MIILHKHLKEKKKNIVPNKDLLNIINKKFFSFVEAKNIIAIDTSCNFMIKYNRFILYEELHFSFEENLWKLLNKTIIKHK